MAHLALRMQEGASLVQESRLHKASFAPSLALRPFIERFLVVEYTAGQSTKLLPGAGIVAAFRFKGHSLIDGSAAPNSLVTGLRESARTLTHSGSCANVIAMFTPTGAAAFLREPVANLFNETMPFQQQVRRSHLDLVEEQLAESHHDAERVLRLEQFLIGELRRPDPDPLVAAALAAIHRSRGTLRIAPLAQRLGFSQSALERRFQQRVGISPKKFAAIVRLRHVVQLRKAGSTLTDIAHSAGYADQAHFIKDFRRFAGEPPESFFQSPNGFC
jgi:AraC-like DNA-binding protein